MFEVRELKGHLEIDGSWPLSSPIYSTRMLPRAKLVGPFCTGLAVQSWARVERSVTFFKRPPLSRSSRRKAELKLEMVMRTDSAEVLQLSFPALEELGKYALCRGVSSLLDGLLSWSYLSTCCQHRMPRYIYL